jgi:DinB superfamily
MDLRYPIGKYEPLAFSAQQLQSWIADIQHLPQLLENAILNLDAAQLATPYREGGWMIQQVVHHVADSHINAIIRFKLALTEDNPTIKPYDEKEWAKLADNDLPVNISLTLLHAVHARWHKILVSMQQNDWNKTLVHPQHGQQFNLWYMLGNYAWHGRHHVAHITTLREQKHW